MKVSLFIDGNNFYHGLRKIYGKIFSLKRLDYFKLFYYLANNKQIIDIFYYNAQLDKSDNLDKFNSQKEFFDKLSKIPKIKLVLCKLLKRKIKGSNKFYYVLKEDDIHMAVDMVEGACANNFDLAILVSGDGDFVPAVKAVQRKDKLVENIYFKNSSSRSLKDSCNSSLELNKDILDKFL